MLKQLRIAALAPVVALGLAAGCHRDPNVRKQQYLESGRRFENEGKVQDAVTQFSNALKLDRNFAAGHYELGLAYLKLGTIAAAYTELLKTIELDPANLPARIQVGKMQLAAGLPGRAMEQVKAVKAADIRYADAYALAASLASQKRDGAEALKQIEQALRLDPNRSDFHAALAQLDGKDPAREPQAEEELQKAIALDNGNVTAHLLLASLLENKDDLAGAEREARAAIQGAPKNLGARRALSRIYVRQGDRAKAEQTLREAAADLAETAEGASVLSDFYLSRGEPGAAESAYADLVGRNPKSFELRVAYARILAIRHKDDQAARIAEALQAERPNSAEVQILNASLLLNAQRIEEAFDVLKKAANVSPDNVQVLVALAKVAELKQDRASAEVSLRNAARIAPENLEVQAGLAEVASLKGDDIMLAQVAETTLEKNPWFADAYLWRGRAEANEKQYDKAAADFQRLLAQAPKNVPGLIGLGQIDLIQKRVPEGMALLEQALDADPNSAAALDSIVKYYFFVKQPERAVARIKQQLDREPRNIAFLNDLSGAYLETHDLPKALETARQALTTAPGDEGAVERYAEVKTALGDPDGAMEAWEKWLSTHPNDAHADSMVAQLEEAKGEQELAVKYYWKALRLEPGQPLASNNLACLLVDNGQNLDTALRLAQDARSGLPNSATTADTLAWVYYARGRYLSARDLLEEAVRLEPWNALAQYHLGMTYRKLGDKANAAVHLKRAATLAPKARAGRDATVALSQPG